MAQYTVQAPDGKTITLEGPDGASHEDVIAQAQQLYKPDAAPKPATPKAAPVLMPDGAKRAWDQGSAILEGMLAKGNFSEAEKNRKRDAFFNDPRIRRLRETAAAPVPNVRFDVRVAQQKARARADANADVTGNFLTSLKSGLTRGAFGIPERLAADQQISSGGETGGLSEEEILEQVRANTDAENDKSMAGNFLGQILSGGLIGGAAAKSIGAIPGVARAAAAATSVAPKTAKIAALATGGAAGGGLQAAGEGSDVSTGAEIGALAGPAAVGAGKGLGFLLRPLADVMPFIKPSADKILRRLTSASMEDIQREAAHFRAANNGAEPTLFELLPLADRNRLRNRVFGSSPETAERTAAAARQRAANIGPEMQNVVETATRPGRNAAVNDMEQQLAEARGGITDISDRDLAAASTRGRLPMRDYTRAVDDTIMAPVRDTPAARDVSSLFPTTLDRNPVTGDISEVHSDPEMNAAIQNAAGSLRLRAKEGTDAADLSGLTANDIANIVRNLSAKKPGQDGYGAAQRAIPHVLDILEERAPTARASIERMRAAHAANSRQLEGMEEGAMTRTRETAPLQDEQAIRNAYDTPEGATGRFLGQANAVGQGVSGTPTEVLRTVDQLANSGATQEALGANLGQDVAGQVTGAATSQQRSARAMAGLNVESGKDADTVDSGDLGRMILALNPHSMPTTKLFALNRLTQLMHIPQKKANTLVDMLFSQDAAKTNLAISWLNNAGRDGKKFLSNLGQSINLGARSGELANAAGEPADTSIIPDAAAAEMPQGEAPDEIPGLVEQGNIDLHSRPVVHNPDGTISTVRSITVGFDDGTYLIPTVVGGKVVSDEEAIAHFKKTHEHLGKFADEASADAYAQQLHEDQAAEYGNKDEGPDLSKLPYGHAVISGIFPQAHVTSDHRGPDNPLYDPNSGHAGDDTVDVRPIPGMTYQEFLQTIRDHGYEIVKSYDESKGPADRRKAAAWGPHWHVQIA